MGKLKGDLVEGDEASMQGKVMGGKLANVDDKNTEPFWRLPREGLLLGVGALGYALRVALSECCSWSVCAVHPTTKGRSGWSWKSGAGSHPQREGLAVAAERPAQ